jgi:hypothetical protein
MNMIKRTALAATLLGAFMCAGSTVPSYAREHNGNNKCEQRVRKAEENLDKAVKKHGEHSRQAEQQRRKVEEARAKCGENGSQNSRHDHRHR